VGTHTNGAHKINNDNITTPMFIGLKKTTQKRRTPQQKGSKCKERAKFSSKCILMSERRNWNNIGIF
jgi:hypothetical protein